MNTTNDKQTPINSRIRTDDNGQVFVNSATIADQFAIRGLQLRRHLRRKSFPRHPNGGWYFAVGSDMMTQVLELAEEIAIRQAIESETVIAA